MSESSSKLLVTRTGIKAWSSLILGQIRPLILKLLALEWRKFHTFELEYLWSQLANLDQILCVSSLGWGKGCIRFWGRLDQNSGFHGNRKPPLTYNGENDVSTFSRLFLIRSFLYLEVTRISDKFEFRPDRTTDYGVSCPWGLKISHILIMENGVSMLAHSFLIESSSKLLVTRTGIKARTSSILGLWFPWPIYMFFEMMDGWVRVLRPFNSISVISRRWKGEHERLCAMKPPAGFEPATPWSEVGSANRSATRTLLFEMRFDLGTLDSGERSLPFGLIVWQTYRVFNLTIFLVWQPPSK